MLVTDAQCYSACDIFAAGFQDHEIGPVLGVEANTGAGGANVVTHEDLRTEWTGGPLKQLPKGVQMRVALRRCLRVGTRSGQPVEDLGVVPDSLHPLTKRDLLEENVDLMAAAGALLAHGRRGCCASPPRPPARGSASSPSPPDRSPASTSASTVDRSRRRPPPTAPPRSPSPPPTAP